MRLLQITLILFAISLLIFSCKKPYENIRTDHKIALGHYLFFEKKLSFNNSKSCASCHSPEFAFTDGYRKSVSAIGENLLHNAPSVLNIGENNFFDWDNPSATALDIQIKRPLYNSHPVEMGFSAGNIPLFTFFQNDSLYQSLFLHAYNDEKYIYSAAHIEECIILYLKSLNSSNNKFDKYIHGDKSALNESELNGMNLFNSEKLKCSQCHKPPSFTLANQTTDVDSVYVNIGLYNVDNKNKYPADDNGLIKNTHKVTDDGKYKIPSLRNILLTAPYMHDGSIRTIQEVIDMYARGGRNVDYGECKGDGALNNNKHRLINGFTISVHEKNDLINFLSALTDTSYFSNPHFTNPFRK